MSVLLEGYVVVDRKPRVTTGIQNIVFVFDNAQIRDTTDISEHGFPKSKPQKQAVSSTQVAPHASPCGSHLCTFSYMKLQSKNILWCHLGSQNKGERKLQQLCVNNPFHSEGRRKRWGQRPGEFEKTSSCKPCGDREVTSPVPCPSRAEKELVTPKTLGTGIR